jgi:hypothetical protein
VACEVSEVFNWLGVELTAVAEEGWAVGAVDVEHVGVAWGCDTEVGLRLLVFEGIDVMGFILLRQSSIPSPVRRRQCSGVLAAS